jgi:hypothetical protein
MSHAQTHRPSPSHGAVASGLAARVVAIGLTTACTAVFVVGTVFWTKLMTDTFSPLGYAMTPVGMYGLAIILIPMMGIIHRLWSSGDMVKREGAAAAAERDRLRTSLLGSAPSEGLRNVRAAPAPENILFGDDEAEILRRRRRLRDD